MSSDLVEPKGAWGRAVSFLVTGRAGTLLPSIFFALLVLSSISRTAMTFLLPRGWQISGYYLDGLLYLLIFFLAASWAASIIALAVRREYRHSIGRLLAVPVVVLLAGVVAVMSMLFLPSMISGWPIDSVYSSTRRKCYILAYEPIPTDTCYRIFSADATRLNPVWKVEFAGTILDYSEDHSLTANPHLVLSGDEQLLVIGRGGHLTDALLVDSRQALTQGVPWTDKDREEQWQHRTDRIRSLLEAHSRASTRPAMRLDESNVKAMLQPWCRDLGPMLTAALSDEGWEASCSVDGIESDRGRFRVWFTVECVKDAVNIDVLRHMWLVQDHGRLLIVEQDRGLSWSTAQEKALAERVRDALLQHASDGTYLN